STDKLSGTAGVVLAMSGPARVGVVGGELFGRSSAITVGAELTIARSSIPLFTVSGAVSAMLGAGLVCCATVVASSKDARGIACGVELAGPVGSGEAVIVAGAASSACTSACVESAWLEMLSPSTTTIGG